MFQIQRHSTRVESSSPILQHTLAHADIVKISLPRVSIEILPVSHVHLALHLLVKHGFFAFLLVSLIVFKGEDLSGSQNILEPGRKLN